MQKALQNVESMEPIVFCGMYDCGLSYLFNLLPPLFDSELNKDIAVAFVDLSNAQSPEQTQKELGFTLKRTFPDLEDANDYLALTQAVETIAKKKRIVLVMYLGQGEKVDSELLLFINRLRNLVGWKFSYCLFLGTRVLFHSPHDELIENIVRQTAVPVLPQTLPDSSIVIENYEERWRKKIPKQQRDKIVHLSGGNPGLIKALFLQALGNPSWGKPDLLDERLFYRLQEIVKDLPKPYLQVLTSNHKSEKDKLILSLLVRYGYAVKTNDNYKTFTPLLDEFIHKYADKIPHYSIEQTDIKNHELLALSKSQRILLSYLRTHPGEIVTRDALAQLLWGDNWADRYSDWALDQLLSVLRERLTKFRIKGKIVTKKGEGIIFLP